MKSKKNVILIPIDYREILFSESMKSGKMRDGFPIG